LVYINADVLLYLKILNQLFRRNSIINKIKNIQFFIVILLLLKIFINLFSLEFIEMNDLFSVLVGSNIFLLSFLLTGVLSDFKEAEKIPSNLATIIHSLYLEIKAIKTFNPEANLETTQSSILFLSNDLLNWLKGSFSTEKLISTYNSSHNDVVTATNLYKGDVSSLRGRLLGLMNEILEDIYRVRVIRETDFAPFVAWMANLVSYILLIGLVFVKSNNLIESLFYLFVISFFILLLLKIISDIDNPFDISNPKSIENVALFPLEKVIEIISN